MSDYAVVISPLSTNSMQPYACATKFSSFISSAFFALGLCNISLIVGLRYVSVQFSDFCQIPVVEPKKKQPLECV